MVKQEEKRMIVFVIGVLFGAFIGWNAPQPQWAKDVQAKVTAAWTSTFK